MQPIDLCVSVTAAAIRSKYELNRSAGVRARSPSVSRMMSPRAPDNAQKRALQTLIHRRFTLATSLSLRFGSTASGRRRGTAPVVLFFHGFAAIWSSWRAKIAAVANAGWRAWGWTCAAMARATHRMMQMPTSFACVGDLAGVFDHLCIATAVVVGHDFGVHKPGTQP